MPLLVQLLWKWLCQTGRILHQLWLEVTGAVFIALAAFGGVSAWKEWQALQEGGPLWKLVAALLFVVMMGAFGIYSFWKARRVR
jgi:hypothetical protein